MKRILLLLLITFVLSNEYNVNPDYGQVIINDSVIENPFLGGFNKPKIQWLDWDFDQDYDLFLLDEGGYIRYFENDNQTFYLKQLDFMSISNISWFFFGQFDSDNEYELITQDADNINQMVYYDNNGINLEKIGSVKDNLNNFVISNAVMTPTFADIDNDGYLDFFTGNMVGTITFYRNTGNFIDGMPEYEHISNFWQEIYIVGNSQRHGASALTFIDIDQDVDLDLSWGDYFQQSLYIILNIGNIDSPLMDVNNIISQYPSENPVVTAGQNTSSYIDIDEDGDKDLFVTVLSGAYGYQLINNFLFYINNENSFELITSNFIETLDLVSDVYPTFVDIDNDNDLDMFVGTDFDMSSFPWTGKIYYFENTGYIDSEPQWLLIDSAFLGEDLGNNLSLEFADIDNDGDYDLFLGDFNGYIKFFRNNGDSFYPLLEYEFNVNDIDLSGYSIPKLVDIDLDGDLDLFTGEMNGNISFYMNVGDSNEFTFEYITNDYSNIYVNERSAPEFIDMDFDGDLDIVIGSGYENLFYYQNIGTSSNAEYIIDSSISFPGIGKNTYPAFYDKLNNFDLFVGNSTGGIIKLDFSSCYAGDINNDLIINVVDIILLINIILLNSNSVDLCLCDLNNDSNVDVVDIIEIVNIVLSSM